MDININNYTPEQIVTKSTSINKIIQTVLFIIAFTIPISTSLTNILLTIFLLLWFIEGNFKEKTKCIWESQACFAAAIVFTCLIIGSLYSTTNLLFILLYLKKMSKLLYLPFFIFYFKDPKQRTITINAIILTGSLTVITGLLYWLFDNFSLMGRPYKNSIDTSLITIISTFLLLHKINFKNNLYVNLSLTILVFLQIFYLFYISFGKTSQLIFLFLIVLFHLQKSSKKIFVMTTIPIVIILIALTVFATKFNKHWKAAFLAYHEYKSYPSNYQENSISQRLRYYKNTLALIKKKPIFGWGTGSFPDSYKNLVINQDQPVNTTNKNFIFTTNPHNEYLSFGSQLGLLGIFVLGWFFYTLLKTSFIIIEHEKYILQGVLTIIMIGCMANSWLMDFTSGHLFIMLTAICLGALPNAGFKGHNRTIKQFNA